MRSDTVRIDGVSVREADPRQANFGYHRELFEAVYRWDDVRDRIEWLTGAQPQTPANVLGLDQMGHFGPSGCERTAQLIAGVAPSPIPVVLELGSGFGGSLRSVIQGLGDAGVAVGTAVGLELVWDHCELDAEIQRSLPFFRTPTICGSASEVPVRRSTCDLVFSTGSVPHFPDMGAVALEAFRVLRPGGWFCFTEEVSLRSEGATISSRFLRSHPPDVFFRSTPAERTRQLADAGFVDITIVSLVEWATELVSQRQRAANLFRGTLGQVMGEASTDRILEVLDSTLDEYRRGALVPAEVVARRPG